MREVTHPSEHAPILAAALIACLAVLGGIVPGVAAPLRTVSVEVSSLARPGIALPGVLDLILSGPPGCELVRAQLSGGGAELNAVRTAFPKSRVLVGSHSPATRGAPRHVLVCPR
jgi:hypothetical protein